MKWLEISQDWLRFTFIHPAEALGWVQDSRSDACRLQWIPGPALVSKAHHSEGISETILGRRLLAPGPWPLEPGWGRPGGAVRALLVVMVLSLIHI